MLRYDNQIQPGFNYHKALPKMEAYELLIMEKTLIFGNSSDEAVLSLPIGGLAYYGQC